MRKLLPIILLILIFSNFSSAQWIHQQSGVSTEEFRNVEFLNENTGFICGYKTILKTTNGGANWINQNLPPVDVLFDISIVDSNIVYCSGWYGKILKTTNGGQNWVSLYSDTLTFNYASHFINKDTGWFAGARSFPNYSFLVKTTNGGVTFTSQAFANIAISDIYFKDANTGLIVADKIYKTTNGGTNWYETNYNSNGVGYIFNKFGIVNDHQCWLVSRSRVVFKSSDFGENWDSITSIPAGTMSVNTTFFIDENTGWTGIDFGRIFKTSDGGFNWFECSTPQPSGFISDIFFLNPNTGWAVEGNNGNIFKTTNGGCSTISIVQNSNHIPERNELLQNYPNPFNNQTKIKFKIQNQVQDDNTVNLRIYDMIGREIAVLVEDNLSSGEYEVQFDASGLTSGMYFYKLEAGGFSEVKKMMLLK
jgi:photosystem II stability/assembly factor-like uncharacterized protein